MARCRALHVQKPSKPYSMFRDVAEWLGGLLASCNRAEAEFHGICQIRTGAYAASVGELQAAAQHFHSAAETAPDAAARCFATIQVC